MESQNKDLATPKGQRRETRFKSRTAEQINNLKKGLEIETFSMMKLVLPPRELVMDDNLFGGPER